MDINQLKQQAAQNQLQEKQAIQATMNRMQMLKYLVYLAMLRGSSRNRAYAIAKRWSRIYWR